MLAILFIFFDVQSFLQQYVAEMVGPVERESCQTILNILVVRAKVVRCKAGRDDEVPEEHGDGQHEQIDIGDQRQYNSPIFCCLRVLL